MQLDKTLKLQQTWPKLCCSHTKAAHRALTSIEAAAAAETRTTIGKKYLNKMGETTTTMETTAAKSYVHFQQLCDPPNTATN